MTKDPEAAAVLEQFNKAIAALQAEWPASQQTIIYGQATYTPAQFLAKMREAVAPLQAVPDARSALATALANRHTALPAAVALLDGFFATLPQYLPPGADVTPFGARARKARAPLTAERKAAANTKRAATRAARHIIADERAAGEHRLRRRGGERR
jgi:hypothetical protein